MRNRRERSTKKDNQERWLLTYSDLITLLMIFFVVMYAISNVDAQKFKAVSDALSKSMGADGGMVLNYPGSSMVQTPTIHNQEDFTREHKQMESIVADLREYIHKNNLEARISVANEERGVVVSFQDPVLFPSGSAEMVPSATSIIQDVGKIIKQSDNYVRVEGHTDNMPINNILFPSNWELSSARATRIVQVLIREIAFPPQRLSATAYGEYRPRAPNDTEPNRQLNRRVDIVLLSNKYKGAEQDNHILGEEKFL